MRNKKDKSEKVIQLMPNDKGQAFDKPNMTIDEKLKRIYQVVLENKQMLTRYEVNMIAKNQHPLNTLGMSLKSLRGLVSEIQSDNQHEDT